ncbi:1602_t:CDS:2 [Acaulospora colombiana]|uniref:1602_t:CDS:1 n=1 Tax=Acaulospora colombiana TaxID=27376 RepID=A0ACA9MQ71_9GLOM|nr:1602_t:CDS:2 [Acaulospora colombiana]
MEEENPPIKQEPIEEFATLTPERNHRQTIPLRGPSDKIKLEPERASIHDWLSKLPASKHVFGSTSTVTTNDANLCEPDDAGTEASTSAAIPKTNSKTKQTAIRSIPASHKKTTTKTRQRRILKKSVKETSGGRGKDVNKLSSSVNEGMVKTIKRTRRVKRKEVDYREPAAAESSTPRKMNLGNEKEPKRIKESKVLGELECSDEILEKKREFQSLLESFDQKALDAYNAYEDLIKELNKSAPGLNIIIEPSKMYNKHFIHTLMGFDEDEDPKKFTAF